jgi:hypothetical protein
MKTIYAFSMDLLHYLVDYQSWICILCGIGVKPKHYLTYLIKWHTDHLDANTSKKARMLLVEELILKGQSSNLLNPDCMVCCTSPYMKTGPA